MIKQKTVQTKIARTRDTVTGQSGSAGKNGASIAPPAYGIDFLDRQLVQKQANRTGLPDNLKNGVENLSGLSLDDVRVHYNSPKPAQLLAHAYTQGTDIHVAPGQEKHLAHEAWHVVQQAQGRVRPTLQMKGVAVNDDGGLEREADQKAAEATKTSMRQPAMPSNYSKIKSRGAMIQGRLIIAGENYSFFDACRHLINKGLWDKRFAKELLNICREVSNIELTNESNLISKLYGLILPKAETSQPLGIKDAAGNKPLGSDMCYRYAPYCAVESLKIPLTKSRDTIAEFDPHCTNPTHMMKKLGLALDDNISLWNISDVHQDNTLTEKPPIPGFPESANALVEKNINENPIILGISITWTESKQAPGKHWVYVVGYNSSKNIVMARDQQNQHQIIEFPTRKGAKGEPPWVATWSDRVMKATVIKSFIQPQKKPGEK